MKHLEALLIYALVLTVLTSILLSYRKLLPLLQKERRESIYLTGADQGPKALWSRQAIPEAGGRIHKQVDPRRFQEALALAESLRHLKAQQADRERQEAEAFDMSTFWPGLAMEGP